MCRKIIYALVALLVLSCNTVNREYSGIVVDKKYPGWERARLVIWKYNDAGYNTNCQSVFIENK